MPSAPSAGQGIPALLVQRGERSRAELSSPPAACRELCVCPVTQEPCPGCLHGDARGFGRAGLGFGDDEHWMNSPGAVLQPSAATACEVLLLQLDSVCCTGIF